VTAAGPAGEPREGGSGEPRARIFDIQRFCVHDGPGIRTTIFLAGCPLRCAWCHNPESFDGTSGRWLSPDAALAEVLEDRDYYRVSGGGVTASGGEPLLWPRFVAALFARAKRQGLHTCVQTAAAVPVDALGAVIEHVDLFQVDLKHVDAARHRALTGAGTERIHENLRWLLGQGASVELRMPVVPGLNDDAEHLEALASFLRAHEQTQLRLLPYQRMYLDKYQRLGLPARCQEVTPPSATAMAEIVAQLGRAGIEATVEG
jgi:pyruvate formate lyase activating enzyme